MVSFQDQLFNDLEASPESGTMQPADLLQLLVQGNSILISHVNAGFDQSRLTMRHRPAVLHDNVDITIRAFRFLMEPHGPMRLWVFKPGVRHSSPLLASSYR